MYTRSPFSPALSRPRSTLDAWLFPSELIDEPLGGGRGKTQVEEGRKERERWSQWVQAWVDVYKRQGELGEGMGSEERRDRERRAGEVQTPLCVWRKLLTPLENAPRLPC